MPTTLRVVTEDHVATVTLEQMLMPIGFFRELGAAFRELSARADLRAVVVCSDAKHWSYGLDLASAAREFSEVLAGGSAAPRQRLHDLIRELQGCFDAVADCPVPVVAAIHGLCIGGGLDLASACDVRLATRDARFSLRETKVAIVADLGSLQRLPGIIGDGFTRELAFTGKDVGAERALAMGLVNELYDDRAAACAAAKAMAAEIAKNPPLTVRGVKQVLGFGRSRRVADGLSYVAAYNAAFLASEDLGEAMAAFLEKRSPRFQGR
jgi:enoyl-CoA hydratase